VPEQLQALFIRWNDVGAFRFNLILKTLHSDFLSVFLGLVQDRRSARLALKSASLNVLFKTLEFF
jgi:hypothetical protein